MGVEGQCLEDCKGLLKIVFRNQPGKNLSELFSFKLTSLNLQLYLNTHSEILIKTINKHIVSS